MPWRFREPSRPADSCGLPSSLYGWNSHREGNLRLYEAARTRSIRGKKERPRHARSQDNWEKVDWELRLLVELVAYDAFDDRLQQVARQFVKLFRAHARHHFFDH